MGSVAFRPEKSFIFRSKLPDIAIPEHLTIHEFVFAKISEVFDRPCLIYGPSGHVYTYAVVEQTARRVACGLRRAGVRRGDVIMLLLANAPEFVFSFLGASFAGATATTANPLCTSAEILKQIGGAGVKLVVTQSCHFEKIKECKLKIVCTDSAPDGCLHFSELASDVDEVQGDKVGAEEAAELLFSSGTSGLPKGVILTHRSVVASITQLIEGENPNLWYRRDDVLLCTLPLFHIYGLNSILLGGLRAGATIVIMPKFELVTMMELVQRYRITIAPVVPPIVLALSKSPQVDQYDLSSLRILKYGAAPISKSLEDAVQGLVPNATLGQGYGMTEAGVLTMSLGFAKHPFATKRGSCGTVVRNAEIKIVDPVSGNPLPRNEAGEICIRGTQLMKGYLNDPIATARTIDGEGWLHTGDVGYVDDDDEIFIVDRLKELIKYKGFQVAPVELEALLLSHPGVADAAVVPMKDEEAGEVPVAFVVRSEGSEVTEKEIERFVSQQVVFYKRIRRVFFADVIPKAPSGKILRKSLKVKLDAAFADAFRN